MRSIIFPLGISIAAALFSTNASPWPWGPQTFDECIIEESQQFQGPVPGGAMASIRSVCRKRFGYEQKPKTAPAESDACNPSPSAGPTMKEWYQTITSTKFRFMPEFMKISARDQFIETAIAKNPQIEATKARQMLLEYTTPPRYVACK